MIKYVIVYIFAFCFFACNVEHNDHIERYENNVIKSKGQLKNGAKHGEWLKFDKKGNLTQKLYYSNDTLRKEVTIKDNRIIMSEEMKGDKRHGQTLMYDTAGNITLSVNFIDDIQVGKGTVFFPDGQIKSEFFTNKNGDFHGELKQYYPNGQMLLYAPDVNNSQYSIFDIDGKKIMLVNYSESMPTDTIFLVENAKTILMNNLKRIE